MSNTPTQVDGTKKHWRTHRKLRRVKNAAFNDCNLCFSESGSAGKSLVSLKMFRTNAHNELRNHSEHQCIQHKTRYCKCSFAIFVILLLLLSKEHCMHISIYLNDVTLVLCIITTIDCYMAKTFTHEAFTMYFLQDNNSVK